MQSSSFKKVSGKIDPAEVIFTMFHFFHLPHHVFVDHRKCPINPPDLLYDAQDAITTAVAQCLQPGLWPLALHSS